MRLAFISLFVFSLAMVAWMVIAGATGNERIAEPVPNTLLTGVLMTVVSLGLWELDSRVAALERKVSDAK